MKKIPFRKLLIGFLNFNEDVGGLSKSSVGKD
jgi:hypothetical protein